MFLFLTLKIILKIPNLSVKIPTICPKYRVKKTIVLGKITNGKNSKRWLSCRTHVDTALFYRKGFQNIKKK